MHVDFSNKTKQINTNLFGQVHFVSCVESLHKPVTNINGHILLVFLQQPKMGAISSLLCFFFIHFLLLSSHSSYICNALEWSSSDAISSNDFPNYKVRALRRRIPSPPPPRVNPPLHFSPPPPRAPPPPPYWCFWFVTATAALLVHQCIITAPWYMSFFQLQGCFALLPCCCYPY